jgi:REP-associated tyrosine transposase
MEYIQNKSLSNVVYAIKLHIVFVTKYRRKVLTEEMLLYAKTAFSENLSKWRCSLIEFGGTDDHVHLLIDVHPSLNISVLINNLKTASSRRLRGRFLEHIKNFYWKDVFWHRAYYVGSVGEVSPETIQRYVEQQSTRERSQKINRPA